MMRRIVIYSVLVFTVAIGLIVSPLRQWKWHALDDQNKLLALGNMPIQVNTHYRDISSVIQPIILKHNVPGMVAAVLHRDTLAAMGAAGVRVRGFPEKVTISDQFHIGSCTKAMTAFLCAFLVEEKLLAWDTKVLDLFPELAGKIDPGFKNLNLQQLLYQRGGVTPNVDTSHIQNEAHGNLFLARQMVMEQALSKPPEVKPGTYLYSNAGYIIAGHMAEKVTGQSWEELMKSHVFSPLNMSSAGFGAPESSQLRGEPWGHRSNGEPVRPGKSADNPETLGPAGTAHCSVGDWAKFINLQLRGAEGDARYLKLSSYKKLQDPVSNPHPAYAMGWMVTDRSWAKGNALTHNGSNTYWYADVWIAPKIAMAVMVICNEGGDNATKACDEVCWALIQEQLKR